jgi:hypothetical protein
VIRRFREERVSIMCGALTHPAPRAVERLAELVEVDDERLGDARRA